MDLLRQLFLLCGVVGCITAFRIIAAPVGTCATKRGYGIFRMIRGQCGVVGGRWNGSPGTDDWTDCHVDWCDIPANGPVSSRYAWGIDTEQGDTTTSDARTYGIIRMTRGDCDKLHGQYNGSPGAADWTDCHLYMKRMDGTDRANIDSLILTGDRQCQNKVAYGIIRMIHRECYQIGGKNNGNPGGMDWIDCHLDICISPVIDCAPSDMWSPIQVCRNPSSSTFTCSFQMKTGITKGTSSSSTSGGSISTTISSETSAELKGVFTQKLSMSVTTGFSWSSTQTSSSTWSQSTTRTLEVNLNPGQSVSINQVVGTCGDYVIDTNEYRVIDVSRMKKLRELLQQTIIH